MIKLVNRSGKFKSQLNSNELSTLNNLGKFLMSKMDFYVAVDTGYLLSRNTYKIESHELYLQNDCHYAIHQEFGTKYQSGTPFMRPSIYNHGSEIKRILESGFSKGMKGK